MQQKNIIKSYYLTVKITDMWFSGVNTPIKSEQQTVCHNSVKVLPLPLSGSGTEPEGYKDER